MVFLYRLFWPFWRVMRIFTNWFYGFMNYSTLSLLHLLLKRWEHLNVQRRRFRIISPLTGPRAFYVQSKTKFRSSLDLDFTKNFSNFLVDLSTNKKNINNQMVIETTFILCWASFVDFSYVQVFWFFICTTKEEKKNECTNVFSIYTFILDCALCETSFAAWTHVVYTQLNEKSNLRPFSQFIYSLVLSHDRSGMYWYWMKRHLCFRYW